jgi:hypothetical protein
VSSISCPAERRQVLAAGPLRAQLCLALHRQAPAPPTDARAYTTPPHTHHHHHTHTHTHHTHVRTNAHTHTHSPAHVRVVFTLPARSALRRYILQTYGRPDVVFTHGQGSWLWDAEGRQFLDFTAGIAVNALGAPLWVGAVGGAEGGRRGRSGVQRA